MLWRAVRGRNGEVNSPDARHQVGNLFAFPLQLPLVGEVLILAAAALAKKRALRLDARGRSYKHFHQIGLRIIFVVSVYACADFFARERKRNHHDPAVHPADADSQIVQVGYLEFDNLPIPERFGYKVFWCGMFVHKILRKLKVVMESFMFLY